MRRANLILSSIFVGLSLCLCSCSDAKEGEVHESATSSVVQSEIRTKMQTFSNVVASKNTMLRDIIRNNTFRTTLTYVGSTSPEENEPTPEGWEDPSLDMYKTYTVTEIVPCYDWLMDLYSVMLFLENENYDTAIITLKTDETLELLYGISVFNKFAPNFDPTPIPETAEPFEPPVHYQDIEVPIPEYTFKTTTDREPVETTISRSSTVEGTKEPEILEEQGTQETHETGEPVETNETGIPLPEVGYTDQFIASSVANNPFINPELGIPDLRR